jgi:hypothetical protein
MPECNWVNQTTVTLLNTEIAWLAGLLDGEGCFYLASRNDKYATRNLRRTGEEVTYGPYAQIRCDIKLAMSCRETVTYAASLMVTIVGDDDAVSLFEEFRKVPRARPLWRAELHRQECVLKLLTTLRPYLVTKALEADLSIDCLLRRFDASRERRNYKHADERDLLFTRLAKGLRNGCGEARAQALALLGQVTPSEAAEGNGSAERLETRAPSPNSNEPHERPAPHLVAIGERVKT